RVGTTGLPRGSNVTRWRSWARRATMAGDFPPSRGGGWGAEGPSQVPTGISPLYTGLDRSPIGRPPSPIDGRDTDDRCARAVPNVSRGERSRRDKTIIPGWARGCKHNLALAVPWWCRG